MCPLFRGINVTLFTVLYALCSFLESTQAVNIFLKEVLCIVIP